MGVMPNIQMSPAEWRVLITLLQTFLPNVKVWAFGSRVKMKARKNSDLDLVVFANSSMENAVANLRDACAESDLPFVVDLHVWDKVPEHFQTGILQLNVQIQPERSAELNEVVKSHSDENSIAL